MRSRLIRRRLSLFREKSPLGKKRDPNDSANDTASPKPECGWLASEIPGSNIKCSATYRREKANEREGRRASALTSKCCAAPLRQSLGSPEFWQQSALLSAVFSALQWTAIKGQLTEMQLEQRPIVWVAQDPGGPAVLPDKRGGTSQVAWRINYLNYGKNFVTYGTYKSFVEVGDGGFQQSYGQTGPLTMRRRLPIRSLKLRQYPPR